MASAGTISENPGKEETETSNGPKQGVKRDSSPKPKRDGSPKPARRNSRDDIGRRLSESRSWAPGDMNSETLEKAAGERRKTFAPGEDRRRSSRDKSSKERPSNSKERRNSKDSPDEARRNSRDSTDGMSLHGRSMSSLA